MMRRDRVADIVTVGETPPSAPAAAPSPPAPEAEDETAVVDPRERREIPSAIRPQPQIDLDELHGDEVDEAPAPREKPRVDIPLAIGVALAVAGSILIVYMSIVLTSGG
jgi:hypothetical protein